MSYFLIVKHQTKMTYLICPHISRISCGGLAQYLIGVRQGSRLCAELSQEYNDAYYSQCYHYEAREF